MEYFSLCSKINIEERIKFNLDFTEIVRKISEFNVINSSFESPYDRHAYIYKSAPGMISFVKDCVDTLLKECPDINDVLLKWQRQQNLNFCSFSCGPALDYLSFCLALSENTGFILSFNSVRVISKSAQWKHALQSLVDSLKTGYLKSFPLSSLPNTYSVHQNPKMLFSDKQRVVVQEADVVFMVKTLNLSRTDEFEERKTYFQNIIAAMKIESYLFCIDTKPSVAAMFDILNQFPGKLIYSPVFKTFQLHENFPESLKEVFGGLPTVMARGSFFVWEKKTMNADFISNNMNLSINPMPSCIETVSNPNTTEDANKGCSHGEDCRCKSNFKKRGVIDSYLSSELLTLYQFYSREKRSKNLKINIISNVSDSSTNEGISLAVEEDIKSILSDICDAIDHHQISGKLHSTSDESFCEGSVTKTELSPGTPCSSDMLSFDTFLEEMENRNKILSERKDGKMNGDSAEAETYYEFPTIKPPVEPNRDFAELPFIKSLASQLVSDDSIENSFSKIEKDGSFTNETESVDKLTENVKSLTDELSFGTIKYPVEAFQKHTVVEQAGQSSSVGALGDPSKVLSKNQKRKARKLLNVTSQPGDTDKSNNPFNTPSNSSMWGASTSFTTATPNSSRCLNASFKTESNNLPIEKVIICKNKVPHCMGKEKANSSPSINKTISPSPNLLKLNKNGKKNEQTNSASHTMRKTVSTSTDVESNYETDPLAIRHLTNRIKALISGFDQLTNPSEKNTIYREKEAMKPVCCHLHDTGSFNRNADGDLNNHCRFTKSNTSVTSTKLEKACSLGENMENDNENSTLEAKAQDFGASSCCTPQIRGHHCCLCCCKKVCECFCIPTPGCPQHGCIHGANQCLPSCNQPCIMPREQVPNIVIPLRNITAEALAQILTILKVTNEDSS